MKQHKWKKIILLIVLCFLMNSFGAATCYANQDAPATAEPTENAQVSADQASTVDGNSLDNSVSDASDKSKGLANQNAKTDSSGTVNQDGSSIVLLILVIVLVVIGISNLAFNIFTLQNLSKGFAQVQRWLTPLNSLVGMATKDDLDGVSDALYGELKAIRKSVEQMQNIMQQYEEKQNAALKADDNKVSSDQFSSPSYTPPQSKSKCEVFVDTYNKYLSGELPWTAFQTSYKVEDEIQFEIDIANNRTTKLVAVSSQGHIQVFSKSIVDGVHSVALLKKNEFAAFNNSQILNMINSVFEVRGDADFATGRVVCMEPALLQKNQGSYVVIKRGIYTIM